MGEGVGLPGARAGYDQEGPKASGGGGEPVFNSMPLFQVELVQVGTRRCRIVHAEITPRFRLFANRSYVYPPDKQLRPIPPPLWGRSSPGGFAGARARIVIRHPDRGAAVRLGRLLAYVEQTVASDRL